MCLRTVRVPPEVTARRLRWKYNRDGGIRTVTSHTRGTRRVPRKVREQQMLVAAGPAFADPRDRCASVDAIAEASGITKPMVYAYFGSKEGLYGEHGARPGAAAGGPARRRLHRAPRPTSSSGTACSLFTFVERERESRAILLGEVTQGTGRFAAEGARCAASSRRWWPSCCAAPPRRRASTVHAGIVDQIAAAPMGAASCLRCGGASTRRAG